MRYVLSYATSSLYHYAHIRLYHVLFCCNQVIISQWIYEIYLSTFLRVASPVVRPARPSSSEVTLKAVGKIHRYQTKSKPSASFLICSVNPSTKDYLPPDHWLFYTRLRPDSKVHGANMGPIWVLSAPEGPHEPCYKGNNSSIISPTASIRHPFEVISNTWTRLLIYLIFRDSHAVIIVVEGHYYHLQKGFWLE